MKRIRRIFIAVSLVASLTCIYNFNGIREYIANAEDEIEDASKLSEKKGSITIKGTKADIGQDNRKYRVVLKKIYTSKDVESSEFFTKFYEVPEYAQGIEVDDGKKLAYNRENIIVANDEGIAAMHDMILGEYEISEADEGAGIPVHTVRLPLTNSSNDTDYNIEVGSEKLDGGAVELSVVESGEAVEGVGYGLYKVADIPEPDEEGNQADVAGEKIGESHITNKNGKIIINDIEKGNYYLEMEDSKSGFIKSEKKHFFRIDSLGKIKHGGGIKIGKIINLNADIYRSLDLIGGINGKVTEAKSNLATPIRFEYKVTIPKNINEYSNIFVNDNFDSKYNIKSVGLKLDGVKTEDIPIENNNNNLTINLSDVEKLVNKKTLTIVVIAEIKKEEDSKNIISNSIKINYNLLDREYEHVPETTKITPTFGRVRIVNIDKKEGHPIHGNKFQIKLDGKVVNEGVTDTRGTLSWSKVPYGDLVIEQVKASDKYEFKYRLAKPVTFVMDDSGAEGSKVTIKTPRKGTHPFSEEYLPYTIVVIILSVVTGIFLSRRKKKRKINIDKSRVE